MDILLCYANFNTILKQSQKDLYGEERYYIWFENLSIYDIYGIKLDFKSRYTGDGTTDHRVYYLKSGGKAVIMSGVMDEPIDITTITISYYGIAGGLKEGVTLVYDIKTNNYEFIDNIDRSQSNPLSEG